VPEGRRWDGWDDDDDDVLLFHFTQGWMDGMMLGLTGKIMELIVT
jgi:hypothetical protein